MRVIQIYKFQIGTKIPFNQWPDFVQEYLRGLGLTYERFLYSFDENGLGIQKAIMDCPKLGPVQRRFSYKSMQRYLTNLDGSGCTEAEIMGMLGKIYRRYGFDSTFLMYDGIDFFSERVPTVEKSPANHLSCLKGASITCCRDSVFPRMSSIIMQIVIGDEHGLKDPTPYLEGMKALLPKIGYTEYVECILTEEEQALYDRLNLAAAPLVEQLRKKADSRLPHPDSHWHGNPPQLKAAPVIKKLCKRFGSTYAASGQAQTRTSNGHYLTLFVDVTPLGKHVRAGIELEGLGVYYLIGNSNFGPRNQQELEVYLTELFSAFADIERELIPALEPLFPTTPLWFVPMPDEMVADPLVGHGPADVRARLGLEPISEA